MRRALTLSAAAVTAAVGVLLPAGPAAAEEPLVPGGTQVLSVALDRGDWNGETPDGITVGVTDLVQLENGCLEPEATAGDVLCDDDEGDLAQQLVTSVAAGGLDGGDCRALGAATPLGLLSTAPVALGVDADSDWGRVDCLRVELIFADRADNNLAQSDAVTFSLRTIAWADVPPVVGAPSGNPQTGGSPPGDTPPAVSPTGDGTGALPGGTAGTGRTGAGNGPAARPGARGGGGAAPADGAGRPPGQAAPGPGTGGGEVLGRTDASLAIGNGVAVVPQAASSSLVGQALAWGGLFVGFLVLGGALFLLVRRRRRTERAA